MNRLQRILFALTIFLIPSNLAYHFITPDSYVNGILVDYLIPKIYLADITITALLFIWCINLYNKHKKVLKINKNDVKGYLAAHPSIIIILTSYFILLARSAATPTPLAGVWFWLKIIQLSVFGWWLITTVRTEMLKVRNTITAGLSLALVFQSLLAIYQYLTQHSLAGYWLLGETTLSTSGGIAKTSLTGALRILPYGTTPHPNVLAGFLAIGLITLFLCTRGKAGQKTYQNTSLYFIFPLTLIALLLTESISAWIALVIATIIIGHHHLSSRVTNTLLITLILAASVGFLILNTTYQLLDTHSFTRRLRLNSIALDMIADYPLAGIGLNQFTPTMPTYGDIPGTTRFLQPVHNIYLLWIAETGAVGILFIGSAIYLFNQRKPKSSEGSRFSPAALTRPIAWLKAKTTPHLRNHTNATKKIATAQAGYPSYLPLLMLLIIGLFDHYPLTLQTGQLLFVLSLVLAIAPHPTPEQGRAL